MKIGRLYISNNKYIYDLNYWLWIYGNRIGLWIGWYLTEDEYIDRLR